MRILSVELTNFKSYSELKLDFGDSYNGADRSVIAIVGENGAGKTTIVEAVGAALFDYTEGQHKHLVREQERSAEVKVTVAVTDPATPEEEAVYTVVRRFGAGSFWHVVDAQTGLRITEKADDTRQWIAEQLGLDDLFGMDISSLFCDAVGVPQGTITAPFLDKRERRKDKFDRLLGLTEFEKSAENLREVEREFEKRISELEADLKRLRAEVTELPYVERELLKTLQDLDGRRKNLQSIKDELGLTQKEIARLEDAERKVTNLKQELQKLEQQLNDAEDSLTRAKDRLREAEEASKIVQEKEDAYRQYDQVEADLKKISADFEKWQQLSQTKVELERELSHLRQQLDEAENELGEAQKLKQQIPELQQLSEREKQIRDKLTRIAELGKQLDEVQRRIQDNQAQTEQKKKELQQAQGEREHIEATRQLAESYDGLQREYENIHGQLVQAQAAKEAIPKLEQRQQMLRHNLEHKEAELTKAKNAANGLSELRRKLEEAETAKNELGNLKIEKARLDALLNETRLALAQSRGGNCPFLKEPCRNMAEGQNLESYFQTQLRSIEASIEKVDGKISKLEPLVNNLSTLHRDVTEAELASGKISELQNEVNALQGQLSQCAAELEAQRSLAGRLHDLQSRLHSIKADLDMSREAKERLASLEQLDLRIRALEEDVKRLQKAGDDLQKKQDELAREVADKDSLERELANMGSPTPSERLQRALTAQEKARQIQTKLSDLRAEIESREGKISRIQGDLGAFPPNLPQQKAGLERRLQELKGDRDLYLQYCQVAKDLPHRKLDVQKAEGKCNELRRQRETTRSELQHAKDCFDPDQLEAHRGRLKDLTEQHENLAREIGQLEGEQKNLEDRRKELTEKEKDKATKEQVLQRLQELSKFVNQLRQQIREVADAVGKHLVEAVAHSATSIFHDIMGGIAGELEWSHEDYSLSLRLGSSERLFPQLSGGEQMAAALAIRLALLQNFSHVRFAFFDEPTQNLDQARREALAEQIGNIQNIRGFDQIFVISHDDTFTTRTDKVIRVTKQAGVSTASLE